MLLWSNGSSRVRPVLRIRPLFLLHEADDGSPWQFLANDGPWIEWNQRESHRVWLLTYVYWSRAPLASSWWRSGPLILCPALAHATLESGVWDYKRDSTLGLGAGRPRQVHVCQLHLRGHGRWPERLPAQKWVLRVLRALVDANFRTRSSDS